MYMRSFYGNSINIGSLLEDKEKGYVDNFINESGAGYAEMKKFFELSKDKKCLLDVGCEIGMFSLVFCNNSNKISHAFDASHLSQLEIIQNILLNQNKKIYYHKLFLGEKDAITAYNTDSEHAYASPGYINDRVLMVRMDTFCLLNDIQPDVIKIDTEGYEYNILLGGKETITTYKPIMFIELHPEYANMYNTYISQVFDLAKELNYSIKNDLDEDITIEKIIKLKETSTRTIWYPN